MMTSTQFSRIGLELFMFCVFYETVCGKNLEIVHDEILKAPRWNASSSESKHIQPPEIKRRFSASPHIPSLKFPEIALENAILLIGPHGFDSFLWWVRGSGGLQSFLLIRELILERLPQPVNTPEPMEPIEPTEGGEDLGVEFGRARNSNF